MAPKGADKRFVAGAPVPPMCPAIELTENRAKNITRSVFGKNGGGVLYQAVRQLIADYFRERRDALESEASSEPYAAEKPKATMEAYYHPQAHAERVQGHPPGRRHRRRRIL